MESMVFRNKFSRCRYIHQLLKLFILALIYCVICILLLRNLSYNQSLSNDFLSLLFHFYTLRLDILRILG